jgi:hypothetical protein
MKNLLTNISQEEKNRILEMHSGMKKTIKEQYEDRNGMNWTQNTTMDRPEPIDEPMLSDEEETMESILEKHNLLDEATIAEGNKLMFVNKSSKLVQKILSLLPSFTELGVLALMDCESADFSDVDICGLPNLAFINLDGTENNFEEQGYECIDTDDAPYYHIQ